MKRFKILPNHIYEDRDRTIKKYYSQWREFNKGSGGSKETFAMIFTSFYEKGYLEKLDGGAVKLFLFFSIHSNNKGGDSWYSITKIANYFKVQTRTIDKWIKSLIDNQLIYREVNENKSSTTYLLPYSTTLMEVDTKGNYPSDSQKIIDDVLDILGNQEVIFGKVIGVYHIFQWKPKKKRRKGDLSNTQWLLFITKRSNGVLTGHYYEINGSNKLVSMRDIKEPYFFESDFMYNEKPLLGIALDNDIDIEIHEYEVLKDLIESLAIINPNDISGDQYIFYGQEQEPEELEGMDE